MGLRALALALVAGATAVAGHGIMTTPAPRDGTNVAGGNKGNNAEPCGTNTATPGTPTATLAAGAETTVRYNLIAAHGGPCEVRIAATDGALAGTAALARNNACNGDDALTVTVPANLAGTAVLQWYWQGDGAYYDCADVTITGGAGGGGTAANAARTGGASSGIEDDCDPEEENCGSGGKIFAAVLLVVGILGGVLYCRSSGEAAGKDLSAPPPIPSRGGAGAVAAPPPIPSRGGAVAVPPIPVRALPSRP